MSKFLIQNFDFGGHLSTLRAQNTPKTKPFKAKSNALTLLNQSRSNCKFDVLKVHQFLFKKLKNLKNYFTGHNRGFF